MILQLKQDEDPEESLYVYLPQWAPQGAEAGGTSEGKGVYCLGNHVGGKLF